ncbi:hypothetical protein D3C85_504330 [compost metagenome]
MTRDAEHTPSPQSVVVPKFGDIVENGWASDDNPTRRGFFVREFKRTGKLNPGRTWEITDGKGKFWEFKPSDIGERLSVSAAPAPSSLAGGEVDVERAPNFGFETNEPSLRQVIEFYHRSHGMENWPKLAAQYCAALSPEAPAREAIAFAMNDGMTTHPTLRSANIARQNEWDQDNQISAAYRGNELAGEVGEACNVIKKLERERLGILGSRATVGELADELADVLICADLIAMHYGIDLEAAVARKFNATSEKVGLAARLAPPESASEV